MGRSIPACAGEPSYSASSIPHQEVYPRVCGGTDFPLGRLTPLSGLSPRVRGNLQFWASGASLRRSIPACAGEPRGWLKFRKLRKVYPRVCGGTCVILAHIPCDGGLSPRVRGNHFWSGASTRQVRSIPACAGEPQASCPAVSPDAVYPRVCGGTLRRCVLWKQSGGLSPRVRGNQAQAESARQAAGSIPACAGEPDPCATGRNADAVYPRVCGGTPLAIAHPYRYKGLSPRVRGNRNMVHRNTPPIRSIPACAGEPALHRGRRQDGRVYPRVCGGTRADGALGGVVGGLSPRVRGNR